MPCSEPSNTPHEIVTRIVAREVRESLARKKLDRVTALLCYVMTRLDTESPSKCEELLHDQTDLFKWWTKHQADDAARIAAEQKAATAEKRRLAALAKLTPEERDLLNLT